MAVPRVWRHYDLERLQLGGLLPSTKILVVMFCIFVLFQFLRTEQKQSIQTVHKELTRAAPICHRYLDGLLKELERMDISEV